MFGTVKPWRAKSRQPVSAGRAPRLGASARAAIDRQHLRALPIAPAAIGNEVVA